MECRFRFAYDCAIVLTCMFASLQVRLLLPVLECFVLAQARLGIQGHLGWRVPQRVIVSG